MLKKALEVLEIFALNGYDAYIVGGYVRDYLLGIESVDIDICTNAKPKDIIDLFKTSSYKEINYGSVKILYKNVRFDITTFRKESKYEINRKPVKIKYIKNLKKDLLRRDFTINTFCMDKNGNVMDVLRVRKDLDNKLIKTVGNPRYRLKEDVLRILRAIRFATVLDFTIDKKTENYIKKYAYLLKNLSYNRKKEELDKIFSSVNNKRGIELLLKFNLDKYLELGNLENVRICNDILGIWAQIDDGGKYPFTALEKKQINSLKILLKEDILDNRILYKYGLYLVGIAALIKGIDKKEITLLYNNLPILNPNDIKIRQLEIANLLNKKPGAYLKEIFSDLEDLILTKKLENNKEKIEKYILANY